MRVRTASVNTMRALLLGAVSNDSSELDNGWLVLLLLRLFDCIRNRFEIGITLVDSDHLPSVREETLLDVFGECACGVSVDGNV